MITLKDKTAEEIITEYKALKELKLRKIKYIKSLLKERPVPDDVLGSLNIHNRNTVITSELKEDARQAFHARQEARLAKQEESLKTIEKELRRRGGE